VRGGNFISRRKMDALYARWKFHRSIKRTSREVLVCRKTVRRYFKLFEQRDRTSAVREAGPLPIRRGQSARGNQRPGRKDSREQ